MSDQLRVVQSTALLDEIRLGRAECQFGAANFGDFERETYARDDGVVTDGEGRYPMGERPATKLDVQRYFMALERATVRLLEN
jgi:hypothetical protein